jgi:hypothetical protein
MCHIEQELRDRRGLMFLSNARVAND